MGRIGESVGKMLLGMVLLAAGGVAGVSSVKTLQRAEAMQGWKKVPATVLSCNLESHRGSKGGYTYKAVASYQYALDGVTNVGTRVTLHSGADNVGQFQRRTYEALSRSRETGQAVDCWVDPQNPADAILFPKPRLELMMLMQLLVLGFGCGGIALFLPGLFGLLPGTGGSPETGCGMGVIRMSGAGMHRVAGALALAVNGYAAFFIWKAGHVLAPDRLPWFVWLLAAAGLIPAAVAGYLIGRIKKYGVSVFEMSPLPGVLGGPVSGTIRIPAKVDAESGFDVKLQCVCQYTTGSGKNRRTHRDVFWEDSRRLNEGLSYGEETMLPVRFSVPYEMPATTVAAGRNGYYWRLSATAATPGIDFKAVFDVPVRRTRQSVAGYGAQPQAVESVPHEPIDAALAREGLSLKPRSDGGFELVSPAGRPRSVTVGITVFVLLWTIICTLLWTFVREPVGLAIAFSVFDVLLLTVWAHQALVSRGVSVDRARHQLTVWRRFAGLPRRESVIPFERVTDIRGERAAQSGNSVYYRVVVAADGGMPATAATGLRMWSDAKAVTELLQAGVKPVFDLPTFRA